MALELSDHQTFFNGLIHDVHENEPLNANKTTRKSPRESKSPDTMNKGRGKENLTPKQPGTEKAGRVSRKSAKEPLKVSNTERKAPKKNGKVALKSATPSPIKPEAAKKKRQNVPKIIVYKDNECRQRAHQGQEEKSARELSKSWEGRKSVPESKKSAKISAGPRKNRHSFNDLNTLKSPNKERKLSARGEVTKVRLPKLKPDDPQFADMLTKLEILFPGVDPAFLKTHFLKFKASLPETIEYVLHKEKTDELPTRADHMRRLETEKLHSKFLESFSVENFLKMIPDPWDHFLRAERHNCVRYAGHSLHYLKNKFKKHYIQAIQEALAKNNQSLYLAHKDLKKKNRLLKMRATMRSKNECDVGKPLNFDVQFVHEVAFIENESKIKAHMKKAEADKRKRFEKAEKEGTLLECQSCNEMSLLPDEEAVSCPANHVFCKGCVAKYVEAEMEKNNFQFKCLIKCEEKFSLEVLKGVLSPGLVAKIIKRNHQLEEIKSAGIEDLVYCPFCYYVVVMPPELTVVKCLNPACLTESCRHCKQLNHIPLKCHELEKFDKTISGENATASPLRCIRCNKEFVKSEDSNKMDCPCGATACSVCRQPLPECPHFSDPNGETGTRLSSCSEDTEYTEADEDRSGSPDSPTDNLHLLPSGSDSF